jgi:hypothetical protein
MLLPCVEGASVYVHNYSPGDLVIWDNFCSMVRVAAPHRQSAVRAAAVQTAASSRLPLPELRLAIWASSRSYPLPTHRNAEREPHMPACVQHTKTPHDGYVSQQATERASALSLSPSLPLSLPPSFPLSPSVAYGCSLSSLWLYVYAYAMRHRNGIMRNCVLIQKDGGEGNSRLMHRLALTGSWVPV